MKRYLVRFFVVALAFPGVTVAADVGRVLLAAGDTVAIRNGQAVKLTFSSAIQDKDVLRTGPASNLQVRFVDESIVSMKESSELRIDEFHFSGTDDGSERAFFRLLKGGLRTVTGLIGRSNHKNYQMSTTTASIGIRGTDYSLMLCQGDCRNSDGTLAKDGLYGRPNGQSHGTNKIDVFNERDQKTFGINESFYVADAKSVVERLLVAPDFLANRLDGRRQSGTKGNDSTGGSGTEQATAGGAAAESRPSTTPDPLPQLQFVATQSLSAQGTPAVLPVVNGFVLVYPTASGISPALLFDDGKIAATFNSLNQLTSYGSLGTFPAGSLAGGSVTDTGSLTLSNGQTFVWGRWTGPVEVTVSGGTTISNVPLLFGTATGLTDVSGSFGGVATYTYAGGPKPVDAGGNVGSITSSTAMIDFTQQTAQLSVAMNFPNVIVGGSNTGSAAFSVSGTGSSTMSGFTGEFAGSLSGTCTGTGCASSSASGFFGVGTTGPNGYDLAVIPGVVNGTQAGDVAFLNTYTVSSFTPGSPPAGSVVGQLTYADATFSGITSTGPAAVLSGTNLVAYGGAGPFSGSLGTGTVVETGSIGTVDGGTMNWGRWSGSGITVIDTAGTHLNPASGVPYVYGSSNTVLPASGSFTYTYAGGPNPTNSLGQVGTFGGGALLVNFGSSGNTFSISSPLNMVVGGNSYVLNSCSAGCTISGVSLGAPTTFTGTVNGSTPITSGASGLFVGPQGAGLAVSGTIFTPPSGATVVYAGAFKR